MAIVDRGDLGFDAWRGASETAIGIMIGGASDAFVRCLSEDDGLWSGPTREIARAELARREALEA